jgi:hypothetical protein
MNQEKFAEIFSGFVPRMMLTLAGAVAAYVAIVGGYYTLYRFLVFVGT